MNRILSLLIGLLCCTQLLFAQQVEVTGKVIDDKGNPISSASVVEKGTKNGVVSGLDGSFTLKVKKGVKIVVSSLGFQTKELVASDKMTIQLNADTKALEEVVVTGYKTVSKREFGGASTVVKGESIKNIPIASFDQMLQGKAPGVVIRASSGQPGASGSIQIRGRGTFEGTQPLFIVDGTRISAADFALLNPNDIESFNILKDASGAALYGSEGANGVVVITTKQGKSGKPKFEIEAFTGWSTFPDFRDMRLMNSNEKIDYELRRGGTPLSGYSTLKLDSLRKINTNWQDEIIRTGRTYNLSASASGGSDKTRYFASVNYFKQEGTVQNTFFDRITARLNLNQEAGNFSFGINTTGSYGNFTNTNEQDPNANSPLNGIQWANPYEQPFVPGRYDDKGEFTSNISFPGQTTRPNFTSSPSRQSIPTTELFWNNNNTKQIRILANGFAEYKIPFIKGLSAKMVYGVDYRNFENTGYLDRRTASVQGSSRIPRPQTGIYVGHFLNAFRRGFSYAQRITNTWSLNYRNKFGDHSFDAGLYYENVDAGSSSSSHESYSVFSRLRNESEAFITPDVLPVIVGSRVLQLLQSSFATFGYGYKGRYFINGNFRQDASSAFGPNNRNANFYGASASWVISDEDFFRSVLLVSDKFINNLKFKVSYGSVGNSFALGPYAYQGTIINRVYNGVAGTRITTPDNPNLSWETRQKFNTGLDFGMFSNKLTGSVDYYNELSKDLLLNREISLTSGFSNIPDNAATVRNSGIELALNYQAVANKDFNLSFNFNFTHNKNEIVELPGGKDTIVSGGQLTMARIKGRPMNQLFLVEFAGVNQANGNAQYRTLDGKITETYSEKDRIALGTTDPIYSGGFGFNLGFKGLELNAQFVYMLGMVIFNNERQSLENPTYYVDNISAELLTKEWLAPGGNATIPRPDNPYIPFTSRFVEDNSFVRLRNVMLSYTFPKQILKKTGLSNLMIYVNGTNLLTFTQYRGRDPESAQQLATTGAQYPALRTVQAGLRVNF
jgi:TonB-linked SusC/RagA family outer membrane protein